MTITFPYRTEAGPTAHSTITLTSAAAERLRGQYQHRPFHDPGNPMREGDQSRERQDLVDQHGHIRVQGVQLLTGGWIRAYGYYDFDLSTRSRIDLLLAPGEVVAVSLESIVSAEGDPLLEAGQPDRETARAALEDGWIATG